MTICDPTNSLCVNHGAREQSCSLPTLQLLYDNHLKTRETIYDKHNLPFIPLTFYILVCIHPDSTKLLHNAFINKRSILPRSCPPRATPCGVGWVKHSMPLCPQRCCVPAGFRPVPHTAPLGWVYLHVKSILVLITGFGSEIDGTKGRQIVDGIKPSLYSR